MRIQYFHRNFNPRSPWGERRLPLHPCHGRFIFQSTLPVGGATTAKISINRLTGNFNPRSPWGERPIKRLIKLITITFQSTLPVGGATHIATNLSSWKQISIHAPRGGSDSKDAQIFRPSLARVYNFCGTVPWKPCPPQVEGDFLRQFASKIRCEPAGKTCALAHRNQIISVSSGWYVFLQPKCSTFFSYWFPR